MSIDPKGLQVGRDQLIHEKVRTGEAFGGTSPAEAPSLEVQLPEGSHKKKCPHMVRIVVDGSETLGVMVSMPAKLTCGACAEAQLSEARTALAESESNFKDAKQAAWDAADRAVAAQAALAEEKKAREEAQEMARVTLAASTAALESERKARERAEAVLESADRAIRAAESREREAVARAERAEADRKRDRERLEKQTDYSLALQRLIEAIVHGHEIPASVREAAPHHYEMAVVHVGSKS